jgi:hypothetical protein
VNARRRKTTIITVLVLGLIVWARFAPHHPLPNPPRLAPSAVTMTAPPVADPAALLAGNQDAARARTVIDAWQAPTVEERQARLAPIVDPAFLTACASIDPTSVPTARVDTVTPHEAPDGTAVVDVVLTDGTAVVVDITADGTVTDIHPAD